MQIEIESSVIAIELVNEDHSVHIHFLNAYFMEIVKQYRGGYGHYCNEMYNGLNIDALMVMQDILKQEPGYLEGETQT